MSRSSRPGLRAILLALGTAAATIAAGPAQAAGIAFVLNSADASISEFDTVTHKEIRRIPVLREPHHMALTPDGRSLVVGDTAGNAAFFLDAQTGAMQRHVPLSDPYQLQYSPDGRYLTVAGLARDQVDIYDAATLTLQHRVPARSMPSHINYSPDSAVAYVSLQDTGKLIAIETASGKVLWTTDVGSTPAGVLWHNGKILVGVMGTTYVAEVNPADGHLDRKLEMAPGPHNLFVSPSRKLLYVTCRVSGTIEQLDWDTLGIVKTFHVAGGPDDIVIAPDGKLWATLRWRQKVAIIDPATSAVSFIPTGRSPHGIWLNTTTAPRQLSMR
jgi:DNA-binding beta-propeller fold protein YncE